MITRLEQSYAVSIINISQVVHYVQNLAVEPTPPIEVKFEHMSLEKMTSILNSLNYQYVGIMLELYASHS